MAKKDSQIYIVTNEGSKQWVNGLKQLAKEGGFKSVTVGSDISKVTDFDKITSKHKVILFIDTTGTLNMTQKCNHFLTHSHRAVIDAHIYYVTSAEQDKLDLLSIATEQNWNEFECKVENAGDIPFNKMLQKSTGALNENYQILKGIKSIGHEHDNEPVDIKEQIIENKDKGAKVISVTSLKPGVGKSGISSSIALMMAERNLGKILFLEGDLQNYSIYQNLNLQSYNNKYSLLDALDISREYLNTVQKNGGIKRSESDAFKIRLKACTLSYANNLDILYIDKMTVDDMNRFNPAEFLKLIALFKNDYDYIVIDSNSNLNHTTAAGVYRLSNQIINILTPDGNATTSYLNLKEFIDNAVTINPNFTTEIHNVLNQVVPNSRNKTYNNLVKAMLTRNTNLLKSDDVFKKERLNLLSELNIHNKVDSIGTDNYAVATQMAIPIVHIEKQGFMKKGFEYSIFRNQINDIIDDIILKGGN